jgi:hypothetical protein
MFITKLAIARFNNSQVPFAIYICATIFPLFEPSFNQVVEFKMISLNYPFINFLEHGFLIWDHIYLKHHK